MLEHKSRWFDSINQQGTNGYEFTYNGDGKMFQKLIIDKLLSVYGETVDCREQLSDIRAHIRNCLRVRICWLWNFNFLLTSCLTLKYHDIDWAERNLSKSIIRNSCGYLQYGSTKGRIVTNIKSPICVPYHRWRERYKSTSPKKVTGIKISSHAVHNGKIGVRYQNVRNEDQFFGKRRSDGRIRTELKLDWRHSGRWCSFAGGWTFGSLCATAAVFASCQQLKMCGTMLLY